MLDDVEWEIKLWNERGGTVVFDVGWRWFYTYLI
jgi:hypothetical protein